MSNVHVAALCSISFFHGGRDVRCFHSISHSHQVVHWSKGVPCIAASWKGKRQRVRTLHLKFNPNLPLLTSGHLTTVTMNYFVAVLQTIAPLMQIMAEYNFNITYSGQNFRVTPFLISKSNTPSVPN